jgi:hypothetical protein
MTSNSIQPMSNGTPEYRRARGILYTTTKIGNSLLSTSRLGLDAGRFKSMQARDRRYSVVDAEIGAVISLVCRSDPMGLLRQQLIKLSHWS